MAGTGCEINYSPGNRIQFKVGVADSYISNTIDQSLVELPNDGDTQLIINVSNVIDDTAELWNDGGIAPRDETDIESYGVVYESGRIIFNFFPNYRQDQLIVVRFQYTSSI